MKMEVLRLEQCQIIQRLYCEEKREAFKQLYRQALDLLSEVCLAECSAFLVETAETIKDQLELSEDCSKRAGEAEKLARQLDRVWKTIWLWQIEDAIEREKALAI